MLIVGIWHVYIFSFSASPSAPGVRYAGLGGMFSMEAQTAFSEV